MDLATFIVTVYCWITDTLKQILGSKRVRQRGPDPVMTDGEVLTMEVVGEFMGLDQDKKIFGYFRRHWSDFFPALRTIHRTTFVRQAAGLYALKQRLWQELQHSIPHGDRLGLLDSFPIPVCQFARAKRHRRFKAEAAFGYDELAHQKYFGFRCHLHVSWPGLIRRFDIAPANVNDRSLISEMTEGFSGLALADRNYHQAPQKVPWQNESCRLLTPGHSRRPDSRWTFRMTQVRRRIETVIGQLVGRFHMKKVWAQDLWHLSSRLLRKLLSHTLALLIQIQTHADLSPLKFDALVN
jgi:Transposase DDE domain